MKGRGSPKNPTGCFEPLVVEPDPSEENLRPMRTEFFTDHSRSVLSTNDSPDVGFDVSLNPYRGCEHGCSYCYARPTHEYLGLSCGLDFETKILVKANAPELLREALLRRSWVPQVVALSGVTDIFLSWLSQHYPHHKQKVEQRLRKMRDGKLNSSTFGRRMSGEGNYAATLAQMFDLFRRRCGLSHRSQPLDTAGFRRVEAGQGMLF